MADVDPCTVRWAKLAGPNARYSYGRRRKAPGERLLFGGDPEKRWGVQLWSISDGVATDEEGGWEFTSNVEWWSYSLPPLPETND